MKLRRMIFMIMSKRFMFILLIPLILSATCQHRPTVEKLPRCFNDYQNNYASAAEVEEFFETIDQYRSEPELRKQFLRDVLSKFGKGRCRPYDPMIPDTVGDGYDVPLSQLEDYGGFHFNDWAQKLKPWFNESTRFYNDTCRRK